MGRRQCWQGNQCRNKRFSALTVTGCALGPQVRPGTRGRESYLLRNVARNVKPFVLRPRRFKPFPVWSSAVAPRSQQ